MNTLLPRRREGHAEKSPSPRAIPAKASRKNSAAQQAVALLLIAFFAFHLSRFYGAADFMASFCPHHVPSQGVPSGSATDHGNNQEQGKTDAADPGARPGNSDSGLRCCCRHSLDGLVTTLLLDIPADLAQCPLPERAGSVALSATLAIPENDLPTPFQPPRV